MTVKSPIQINLTYFLTVKSAIQINFTYLHVGFQAFPACQYECTETITCGYMCDSHITQDNISSFI